jgi:Lrp/AsnC family transcriptional regulator, leucine-responsive regulatory protein
MVPPPAREGDGATRSLYLAPTAPDNRPSWGAEHRPSGVIRIGGCGPGASAGRGGPPYDTEVLDGRDLEIIAALQDDARATYADVGQRVGLAPSSVHDRVRKLERMGAIRGYRAVVDHEALGLFVTALIAVTPLDPTQPDDLPDRVHDFPEVEDCFSVAGEANYVLKVRTKTTRDLEDLIRRLREKGEVQTRTTIVLSIPFEGRPVRP